MQLGESSDTLASFSSDAEDYDRICAAIQVLGGASKTQTAPELSLRHLFIKDPDAVLVELNFPAAQPHFVQ